MAEVTSMTGQKGDYTVSVKISPRYVNENCIACWLSARETQERLDHNATMRADANEALKEAGLEYQGKLMKMRAMKMPKSTSNSSAREMRN